MAKPITDVYTVTVRSVLNLQNEVYDEVDSHTHIYTGDCLVSSLSYLIMTYMTSTLPTSPTTHTME